ncbi:DNA translocase FtsK [uncultured Prevotella sp.]|uniref:FtsK/SpoIIIE family DNA translocase n=1 Tax=uncultured Prevotella sp. TaxID=159272 RepID=UPI00261E9477|nr:DNA translocase FtsK [uncultured Prevotella sp.]
MAKKKNTRKTPSFTETIGLNILQNDLFNFIFGILLFVFSMWMIVAFISYFSTAAADQSLVMEMRSGDWLNKNRIFMNMCGPMGALISDFFIARCFGFSAFIVPVFLCVVGLKMIKAYKANLLKCFLCFSIVMVWCSVVLAKFLTPFVGDEVYNPGGGHGEYISCWLENVIGTPGLVALLAVVAILFLTYLTSETINVIRKMLNPVSMITNKVGFYVTNNKTEGEAATETFTSSAAEAVENPKVFENPTKQTVEFPEGSAPIIEMTPNVEDGDEEAAQTATGNSHKPQQTADPGFVITKAGKEDEAESETLAQDNSLSTPINPKEPWLNYKYPTLSLLKKYDDDDEPYIDMKEQTANKNRIVEVLNSFGVQIRTISATVGPTITLYEITPAEGVKISKIRNLEDDIALSLKAAGVRIIAPIPGKGTIGIEVPNAKANIVSMESILNSEKFQKSTFELPIALGKTITNEVFMVDLAKIPHLLVAGATGQGKSVGLNAIITSLLYKKHPNELKIVLIDPKKVEFSIYGSIANHFMAKVPDDDEDPIITDVTKVVRTLNSLCKLMDTRYDMLKMAGARNIKEYNKKFLNHQLRLTDGHEFMPYIVVVIDEFGDLIMQVGKEVETPIARIAQLARAVGIHMVIATQRPTTSIITGNIKANFPGRMAFKVSAMIDSRTILDRPGANQLIGRGDMLFLNGNEPVRVQCAFVDTPEVERINEYIAQQPGPIEPMELPEPATDDSVDISGGGIDSRSLDPLFEEAAHAIVITQQGSTSMIQRRFSIGYNRAGRLMDQLEKAGIVGAAQGSKPREVMLQDENSLENVLAQLRQ